MCILPLNLPWGRQLVDQTFKENGWRNPDEMHQAPPDKLWEIFGADATLYITVTQYGSSYLIFIRSPDLVSDPA
jgi:hypothetical protein